MAVIAKRAGSFSGGFPWKFGIAPLGALLALCVIAIAVSVAFADRALPRVIVAGVDVGGANAGEIRDRLEREAARPWAAAHVVVNGPDGLQWSTTNAVLGIAPDLDRAVSDALAYGHQGSAQQRLLAWVGALRDGTTVPFAMRSTGTALDAWVTGVASAIDRAPSDGVIAATPRGVDVTPAVIGRTTDRVALRGALLGAQSLDDRTLDLSVKLAYPAVDQSGLREAALAKAVTTPLQVRAADRELSEDAAGLATLLIIEKVAATPGEVDAIPAGATAPGTRYSYHVRLDPARVAAWAAGVARVFDRPARNATFAVQSDGSLAVVPSTDGVKIDQARLVSEALAQLGIATSAPRIIEPSFSLDKATFTTDQAAALVGKMTQVASFTTTYPPSESRHANITTGAMQFNDVVLAPGESFSFWDRLGPVTVERGYAYAGAIIDNRSDENVIGGGLCQVSTTLFNAVARAGLDVLERHAHGYYIERYPLGFDAAVFDPGADFRWRNDTPYPVLIKAYPQATALRFDLISVPTGRRVVIGDPIQTALTDPAPNQPADPAYPPGAVTQGRTVTRSWTVWQGDAIVHALNFGSLYVPVWGGPAR